MSVKKERSLDIQKSVELKIFPRFLYKYRTFNENTEKIIRDNALYFSDPDDFNDPYDCNPPINTDHSEEDIKDWALSMGINENCLDDIVERIKRKPAIVAEIVRKNIKNCGICCFSTLYDSNLMWSHYAKYHKGICLKFDITKDPDFFTTLLTVRYHQLLPHFDFFSCKGKIFEKCIQAKHTDWSYESEVRILKTPTDIFRNNQSRVFQFKNSEALEEIIFGAKTDEKTIECIKNLCNNPDKSHVKFSKMKLKEGIHYGLETDPSFK